MLFRLACPDEIYDRVAAHASDAGKDDFYTRLSEIADDPYPGGGDISEYKDPQKPGNFTATFLDGLICYEVMENEDDLENGLVFIWELVLRP